MELGQLMKNLVAPILHALSDFIAKVGEILEPIGGFFVNLFNK